MLEMHKYLEITDIKQKYDGNAEDTLKGISLYAKSGEIVGILGQNGQGKTTLLNCVIGAIPFYSGVVKICENDIKQSPIEAKRCFCFVSDTPNSFETMTGMEYLNFVCDIYGISTKDRTERFEKYEGNLKLGKNIYNQISSYSHGMKQKIIILSNLLVSPKVWFLDEPLTGLDPQTSYEIRQWMKDYKLQGKTVVFSSHNLDVVEKVCDRVYVIQNGELIDEINMKKFSQENKSLESYFLNLIEKKEKTDSECV